MVMAPQSYLSAITENIWRLQYLAGIGLLTVSSPLHFGPHSRVGDDTDLDQSAASEIPWAWHNVIGDIHVWTAGAHAKYGEIVRLGPDTLSFINEQAWKDIYMHRQDANGKAMKQLAKNHKKRHENGVYSLLDAPDDVHSRQRKMLSHAFSDRALREQEPLLRSYTDLVVRNLTDDARCNRPVDIVETFNFLTFDVIGELAFGESFHACETREEHPWFALFFTTIKWTSIFSVGKKIPFAPLILIPAAPLILKSAKDMFAYTKEKVRNRIATGDKERPDFMARVLKHNTNDGTGITIPEIESTFELLAVAGSETTATLMSGLMWLALNNPPVLSKLQQEIRSAFASDSEITLIKIDHLTYLQATLQESLRMYPPVPVTLTRVTGPEGISICGEWIPGNTAVGVPHRAASLSPTNFHEPMTFAPERFFPEGKRPAKYDNDKRGATQPFSAGPRNCLGKNLAYAEMKLTISRLIYNFDFEVVNPKVNWYEQKVWGLYDKKPLMIRVRERKPSN
ncbi:hypothetical protein FKW77_004385 [Venturia effusa]|uniref:Cytochrome P450 monooxygenase n=1 Tax=Venturia effusa TaxID=50376 RepID=A0A517LIK8_9PEZI|nr:hypothetical protein FKW77_004385 [Venturia effusa]